MAASDARREVQRVEEKKGAPKRATGFDIYGSIRVRYREQGGEADWQDGSSRIGADAEWQFRPGSFLLGRYEAGFNVLTGLENLSAPGEETGEFRDTFFTRLRYVGLDAPHVNVIAGKNWSPYYDVAGFTDRFQGTGASASAVMTTHNNYTVALAYNHASIDLDDNPSLRDIGITGSARALLLGTRAFGDRWYAALLVARLENHETTVDGTYFDGWGSEFYGQYQLSDRVWLVGGYNILQPDSDQVQARDFRVRYGVLGLRYTFEKFRRMIFANVRINDDIDADGTPGSNVIKDSIVRSYAGTHGGRPERSQRRTLPPVG